jgi:nitric oxide reductase subunit B
MEQAGGKRDLIVSKGWLQACLLVVLLGFLVFGILAYETYQEDPPVPARVVDPAGRLLFTKGDVEAGQKVFLHNGLMEYGSIFGHSAYLGPDYTDDYLHRAALSVRHQYAKEGSDAAAQRTIDDFQANRYDPATNTIAYSAAQARAFAELRRHYADYFGDPSTQFGLRPDAITDPQKITELTAFSWSAWAAAARRPGHDYSYTNNWPSEKLVDNQPTVAGNDPRVV